MWAKQTESSSLRTSLIQKKSDWYYLVTLFGQIHLQLFEVKIFILLNDICEINHLICDPNSSSFIFFACSRSTQNQARVLRHTFNPHKSNFIDSLWNGLYSSSTPTCCGYDRIDGHNLDPIDPIDPFWPLCRSIMDLLCNKSVHQQQHVSFYPKLSNLSSSFGSNPSKFDKRKVLIGPQISAEPTQN